MNQVSEKSTPQSTLEEIQNMECLNLELSGWGLNLLEEAERCRVVYEEASVLDENAYDLLVELREARSELGRYVLMQYEDMKYITAKESKS